MRNKPIKRCPICLHEAPHDFVEEVRYKDIAYRISQCAACMSQSCAPMLAAPPEYYEYKHPKTRWEYGRTIDFVLSENTDVPFLELGCGEGFFLDQLSQVCPSCEGIDFNARSITAAQEKGLVVRAADIEDENFSNYYGYMAFFHLLEHLENPDRFVKKVYDRISEGGVVFCSIPNITRFQLHFMRDEADYPPNHLTRISSRGVLSLFGRNGFELVEIQTEPNNVGFIGSLRLTANNVLERLGLRSKVKGKAWINYPTKLLIGIAFMPYAMFYAIKIRKKEGYTILYIFRKIRSK